MVTSLLAEYFQPSITCPVQDRVNLEWIGPVQWFPPLSLAQLIKSNLDSIGCLATLSELKIAFRAGMTRPNEIPSFGHLLHLFIDSRSPPRAVLYMLCERNEFLAALHGRSLVKRNIKPPIDLNVSVWKRLIAE